jgi:dephospho-CoA kinase
MSKNFIICGEIASGKDTAALAIPGVRVAFADELKYVCRLIRSGGVRLAVDYAKKLFNGREPDTLVADIFKFSMYPPEQGKDRKLLQTFGTEYARKIYPDIWVDALKAKLKPDTAYIVTDARFVNELEAFPNFVSIFIDADLKIRKERVLKRDGEVKEEWFCHAAEKEIVLLKEKCQYIVTNNGTIEELHNKIKQIMEEVNEG